jgi:hypothetical protein
VDDIDTAIGMVKAVGGLERPDINEALGIDNPEVVHGELKFQGPDGVIFDLGQPGFWKNSLDDSAHTSKEAAPAQG